MIPAIWRLSQIPLGNFRGVDLWTPQRLFLRELLKLPSKTLRFFSVLYTHSYNEWRFYCTPGLE